MKVLLISANTVLEPYPVYPLGLDYVAGAIAGDHEVRRLDMNCPADRDGLQETVQSFHPDVVGISLRNIDNTDVLHPEGFMAGYQELVRGVRRLTAAKIVLGGSGFTIFPEEAIRLLQADYGIVGEGESFALLLSALAGGQTPDGIPGLISRTAQPAAAAPWSRSTARRFDPQASYLAFYLRNGGMLNLQTKRGCPFKCIYCSYPHIEGRVLRRETPEQVARTAVGLEKAGARYIFITDSAFNADVDHSLAVARAFRAAGLSIPWGGFFAPTRLPQDYFQVMADCGLKHVEFGTEAMAAAVLQAYRKPFGVEEVMLAHRSAISAGLHVAHYFLFGGPGETEQTLETSFSNIDKLERTVLFLFCGMRIYPHTGLYDLAIREGQLTADQSIVEPVFYAPASLGHAHVAGRVGQRAQERDNWVIGAGGDRVTKILNRMYRRGHTGPLWELLIR
ncbi:MAG: radical SAM protein [Desulfobacteraceae bacterium]|nr:MAG: radical SAM protein [Desulfobacteraceae bacterium]